GTQVFFVEGRSRFNLPVGHGGETAFQFCGTGDALRVVVKGQNAGSAKPHGSKRMDAATGANVEKRFAANVAQHFRKTGCRLRDAVFVHFRKKARPVLAKLEACQGLFFARSHLEHAITGTAAGSLLAVANPSLLYGQQSSLGDGRY